jgi:hypothetical protein
MPLVVWLFIPGAAAVVFAILQVPLVIIPNALRLAKVLKEKRPKSWEALRLNPEKLLEEGSGIGKSRQQIKYWFSDVDCDLPNVAEYKKAVRRGMIRLAASGVVLLVSIASSGAMMFWQR